MNWAIKQRLNFYTREFRPPALPRDIALLLWRLGFTLLVLMVLVLILGISRQLAAASEQHWQQQQKLAAQALQTEQQRRPPPRENPQLRRQLDDAQAQLRRSQLVLNYLGGDQLSASQSFTERTRQLADAGAKDLWLQRFQFSSGGRHLRLEGFLTDPAQLAVYVAALHQQSAFQAYAFRQVDVQRSEKAALSFVLDSRPPALTAGDSRE